MGSQALVETIVETDASQHMVLTITPDLEQIHTFAGQVQGIYLNAPTLKDSSRITIDLLTEEGTITCLYDRSISVRKLDLRRMHQIAQKGFEDGTRMEISGYLFPYNFAGTHFNLNIVYLQHTNGKECDGYPKRALKKLIKEQITP